VLVIFGIAGSVFYWLDWESWARTFLLCYLAFVIVLTAVAAYEKQYQLERKNNSLFTAEVKFRAEVLGLKYGLAAL
jgi:hypothetical protein